MLTCLNMCVCVCESLLYYSRSRSFPQFLCLCFSVCLSFTNNTHACSHTEIFIFIPSLAPYWNINHIFYTPLYNPAIWFFFLQIKCWLDCTYFFASPYHHTLLIFMYCLFKCTIHLLLHPAYTIVPPCLFPKRIAAECAVESYGFVFVPISIVTYCICVQILVPAMFWYFSDQRWFGHVLLFPSALVSPLSFNLLCLYALYSS